MTSASAVYRLNRANAVAWAGLAAIAVYFAVLMHAVAGVAVRRVDGAAARARCWSPSAPSSSSPSPATTISPLTTLIVVALVVKLAASFVRYYVAFSLYGTGDAERLRHAPAPRSPTPFHRGETVADRPAHAAPGRRRSSTTSPGVIYAVMGPSRLGGFLVYSFIGFWGLFLFHRAALHRPARGQPAPLRPARVLPAVAGVLAVEHRQGGRDDAVARASCAYGAARILERTAAGAGSASLAGVGLGYMVRPHVPVVVLAALAVAVVVPPSTRPATGARPGRPRSSRSSC